jgi:acyl carrier protein
MTEADVKAQVLEALREVAPEVDVDSLDLDRPLRQQADIDSYDFLNFLLGLHERLGVDVPEHDYARIPTLGRLIAYLTERLPGP